MCEQLARWKSEKHSNVIQAPGGEVGETFFSVCIG